MNALGRRCLRAVNSHVTWLITQRGGESPSVRCYNSSPPPPSPHADIMGAVMDRITHPNAHLFVVVQVNGKQFRVSEGDVIQTDRIEVETGGDITLDKVLLCGSLDYTLMGRPLLPRSTVTVTATVIEKSRGPYLRVLNSGKAPMRTYFWGKRWKKMQFHESQTTMLRIRRIELSPAALDNDTQ